MLKLLLCLFVVLFVVQDANAQTGSKVTNAQKIQLLKIVNNARRALSQPQKIPRGGDNKCLPLAKTKLKPMTWDKTMAAKAQKHANKCVWKHSTDFMGSENMAGGGVQGSKMFIQEAGLWRYDAGCLKGETCGHYTTIIRQNRRKMGCGIKNCKSSLGFELLVCQYMDGPKNMAGRYTGSKVYARGKTTTRCPKRVVPWFAKKRQGLAAQSDFMNDEDEETFDDAMEADEYEIDYEDELLDEQNAATQSYFVYDDNNNAALAVSSKTVEETSNGAAMAAVLTDLTDRLEQLSSAHEEALQKPTTEFNLSMQTLLAVVGLVIFAATVFALCVAFMWRRVNSRSASVYHYGPLPKTSDTDVDCQL